MKRHAQTDGVRTGGAQQRHGFLGLRAEFAGQIEHRFPLRQREPHDQADAGMVARFRQDFRQFCFGIQDEIPHAMPTPRFPDGAARLDRVHEVDVRVAEHGADQRDLGRGCTVEVADATIPQCAQHGRVRVALHRVQHVAREGGDEVARRGGQSSRADAVHGIFRAQIGDQGIDRRQGLTDNGSGRGDTTAEGGDGRTDAHRNNPRDSRRTRPFAGTHAEPWEKRKVRQRRRKRSPAELRRWAYFATPRDDQRT